MASTFSAPPTPQGAILQLYANANRAVTFGALTLLASKLPGAFDTSHHILASDAPAGLRWDALHYVHIALNGYTHEQQAAFMPLWPLILRLGTVIGRIMLWASKMGACSWQETAGLENMLRFAAISGMLISQLSMVAATAALYQLTWRLTSSTRFAFLSAGFYILAPCPAVMVAPYTEPLYAFLTFRGFDLALQKRWSKGTLFLAATTGLRSTGVFSSLVLAWLYIFGVDESHLRASYLRRALPKLIPAAVMSVIVALPFVAFQAYTYASFCQNKDASRPWCDTALPLSYSFVQKQYWNVGLLNYWTMEQLPNIFLASPVLLASIAGTYSYLREMLHRQSVPNHPLRPAQHLALLPFHLHHLLLTFLLLFSSHTQIALRLSITNPVIWWNVASMAFDWSDEDVNANLDEASAIDSIQPSEKPISEAPANGGSDPSDSMEKSAKTDYVSATAPRSMKGKLRTKKMTLPGKLWVGWTVVWSLISLILWSGHYPPA